MNTSEIDYFDLQYNWNVNKAIERIEVNGILLKTKLDIARRDMLASSNTTRINYEWNMENQ